MAEIYTTPQASLRPLSSDALERDADAASIHSDEAVEDDGTGTSLPASEADEPKPGGATDGSDLEITPPPPD